MMRATRRHASILAAGVAAVCLLSGPPFSGLAHASADEGHGKSAPPGAKSAAGTRSRTKRRPIPAPESAAASPLAPLFGPSVPIASVHTPFGSGECGLCHEGGDGQRPGPVKKRSSELCFECHDQMQRAMKSRSVVHRPARDDCGSCHNPHNSAHRSLLLQDPAALCLGCHAPVKEDVDAEVKHPPVHEGRRCLGCHDPHAAEVPALLQAPAYELCLRCHGAGAKVEQKPVNLRRLLEENPVHHAPVAAKNCGACHQPHGSPNFRLLVQPYPPKFYAAYDPANYKLCWECHKQALAEEEETTTATNFRDGARNLHYLHVNKEKGRTCRACHEVHASKQPHQIRDTVPFGAEGWTLELHYAATPTGGICQKTCHGLRSYDHGPLPPAAGK